MASSVPDLCSPPFDFGLLLFLYYCGHLCSHWSIVIFISVLRPCKSLSYCVHLFCKLRLLIHFAHSWCALLFDFLKHFGVSFACRLRQAFAVVAKGHNLRCLCSTSPSGGNQVDGLPPASSFSFGFDLFDGAKHSFWFRPREANDASAGVQHLSQPGNYYP